MLKSEQRIKELIKDEVCMGTYGLVELELRELIKEVLNLAAENAKIMLISDEQDLLNGGYKTINKDSILNLIK